MVETESGGAVEAADQRRQEKAQNVEAELEKELAESYGKSQIGDSVQVSEFQSSAAEMEAATGEAKSEIVEKDHYEGARVNSVAESSAGAELKKQVVETHPEVVASLIPQGSEAEIENQMQSSICPTSLPESAPTSVAQSQAIEEQSSLSQKIYSECIPVADHPSSTGLKTVSVSPIVKTPISDGYNWRKYGQKQVKSPKGSRSYYKCTYSDCCAKKIECSNDLGCLTEVVNKGSHSHDPPRKNNIARESRHIPSIFPVSADSAQEEPARMLGDRDPSVSAREPVQEPSTIPERKRHNSSASNGIDEIEAKENHTSEPEPKRRVKKDNSASSDSISKHGKKHKFVVHAAGDVGISGDGYRWRKYGQKMVKGNSNPRNYYRCTSAGCPARKHIETAVDNSTAVIITYKGVHDHDMPVPKKRHGPPSAPLVAAAAPASMNNLQTRTGDAVQTQITANQCSVGKEGELGGEALDVGGEKTMESARTLLSIGFEIKQC